MTAAPIPPVPTEAGILAEQAPTHLAWAHPTKRLGVGTISAITGAFFGTWVALLPATSVTLALKVNQIAPETKAASLSLVLGIGAFVALVAQNIFGALSDRTTSRWGMRKPWLVGGVILAVASLFWLATASSVLALVFAWSCTQLTFNILLGGLNPVVPDQTPSAQLGKVSGLTGLTQSIAVVVGAYLAQLFLPDLTMAILIPGVFSLIGVGVLVAVLRDRTLSKDEREKFSLLLFIKAFWVNPLKAPDFALAWVSRFLVMFGHVAFTGYQVFFLMDRLHFNAKTVGTATFQVLLVSTVCTVLTAVLFGFLSDRLQRRKAFVLLSAIVLAAAHIVASFAGDFGTFLVASAIAGVAMGAYTAVDMALIAEVLPDRARVGKDMGVLHLANVLPQTIAPAVAPVFLLIGPAKDNYPSLFIGGAIIGIVGAIINQFIKSVR